MSKVLFTVDTKACVLYIKISDDKVHKTKEILPEVFVDYNAKNQVIGIDVVSPCATIIRRIAKKLHLPIMKDFRKFEELSQI